MSTVDMPSADQKHSCGPSPDSAVTSSLVALIRLLSTQLNIVQGHAQLLLLNDTLDKAAREQLGEIEKACQVILEQVAQLVVSSSQPPLQPESPPPRLETRKVLIVEDNPSNRTILQMQFESLGYEVELVANPVEALDLWENGRYGLILTDLWMPGMDGVEFAARIRNREKALGKHRTPIVALTAAHTPSYQDRCQQAGMEELLAKPLEMEGVCCLLERYDLKPAKKNRIGGRKENVGILDLYRLSAGQLLNEGQQLLAQHKWKRLSECLHSLRSASLSMRFGDIVRQIEVVERLILKEDNEDIGRGLVELQQKLSSIAEETPEDSFVTWPSGWPEFPVETIREALEQEGYLALDYQPVVNPFELRSVAMLARPVSRNPDWHLLPTEVIFYLATCHDVIDSVCEYLLTQALLALHAWQMAGHQLRLVFPVPKGWLEQSRLTDFIRASLRAMQIKPDRLILKVASGLADVAVQQLKELVAEGVGLYLDDLTRTHHPVSWLMNAGFEGGLVSIHNPRVRHIRLESGFSGIVTDITTGSELKMAQSLGANWVTGTIISPPLKGESVPAWLDVR